MTLLSGWRLSLRLAWREVKRSKARSALILFMVTFPVIAVIAADVAQATASVSSVEGLDRRLGSAEALVTSLPNTRQAFQLADPDNGGFVTQQGHSRAASLATVERALGGHRPATELLTRRVGVHTDLGVLPVDATGVDLHDPLAKGLYRLTSGRFPTAADEVAVNAALAAEGFHVGDRLTVGDGHHVTVVGTAEAAGPRAQPLLVGLPSWLPAAGAPAEVNHWLVGGAPVTWDDVRALNQEGAVALSREVIERPPSTDQLAPQIRQSLSDAHSQLYTVLLLIGVMALLEVVLLAGPAFAVGARRQSRTLALIAANGGGPPQSRRVILASAVVLGTIGAAVGTVLGIVAGRILVPLLQAHADTYFGPFQIRWSHVLGVAFFGFLSALLAAAVPAWIASRQDVVAVLAGRRGDRKPGRRSPVVGVVLLAIGLGLAVLGSRQSAGDLLIAAAAVVSVFGMIFLVPVVVVAVARLGRRMPLPLRYAVRDAARHRTRTVPAVAAVAATVAGVVALSIANSSDQAQAKADYDPLLPQGLSSIVVNRAHPDWTAVTSAVTRTAGGARVETVHGVATRQAFELRPPGRSVVTASWSSPYPTPALVSDGNDQATQALLSPTLSAAQREQVKRALGDGRAVVFAQDPVTGDHVGLRLGHERVSLPAVFVPVGTRMMATQVVLPPSLLHRIGVTEAESGLLLAGSPLTASQEDDLRQVLGGLDSASNLYVERGYQTSNAEKIVLWILFGLGATLMLGGTLTATFLALSDARPDLATLSAVGASPRTRRGVAAAYALAVGFVGAVLGAAVGFIPGVAVTYPLTRGFDPGEPSHYLDIPWMLIGGLVIALPLFTALVVGLLARSRLPVVARLD